MSTLEVRRPVVSNQVFAAWLCVFVEVMFFTALLSAYFVIRRGRIWEIPGSVHLPALASGFNTVVLLASGVSLLLASRSAAREREHVLRAMALGALFVAFQAYLGGRLVASGLTFTSSVFGGCYFLLVGAHLLHAVFGLGLMGWTYRRAGQAVDRGALRGLQLYWFFVVAIWPVLYAEIFFQ